ncbi:MAG: sulfite exporter TauE/SafE family protein, partial [Prolixibacteraceae bacterium]
MIFHSPIEPIYFILPILGLLIGLFGTVLGGGGGFFFLPILTLLLRVPAQTAVITSLVATLPVCLVGSVGHYRKSHIDFPMAARFAGAGIAGAFIGAGITSLISAGVLKVSFG